MSINPDLLEKLRCPACVQQSDEDSRLDVVNEVWLVCRHCDRKYPIRDDIPVMLIDEGSRWQNTPVAELPAVPPEPAV